MKTNEQIIDDLTAAMADTWLAACNLRVIVPTLVPTKFMVISQQGSRLFGPASGDECQLFVHRAAAREVLQVVGTYAPETTAAAARVMMNGLPPGA